MWEDVEVRGGEEDLVVSKSHNRSEGDGTNEQEHAEAGQHVGLGSLLNHYSLQERKRIRDGTKV